MPVVNGVDYEFYCPVCGAGLCRGVEVTATRRRGIPCILVAPCQSCLLRERIEGYRMGLEASDAERELYRNRKHKE